MKESLNVHSVYLVLLLFTLYNGCVNEWQYIQKLD